MNFFDEVWFPELKREEAQNILETDKSELKVSKSRDKSPYMPKSRDNSPYMPKSRDNSPYPRAGSVASVTGPRMSPLRASAAPSGSWRGSEEPSMDRNMYNYNSPQAVDHYRRTDPSNSLPGNNFYGNSRNTFQRSDVMDPRGLAPYRDTGSPYSANSYRDPPYRDTGNPYPANTYRDPQYRDPASPYSVNIGPGYAPPPISAPYGTPDPGRSQTRPLMPPGPSSMQRRPGWGNRPY